MSTVGEYVLDQIHRAGAKHIFGVTGDYALPMNALAEASDMEAIGCTTEAAAGHAADVYARVQGLGALLVTYGVGAYTAFNAVACAYAEKSPLVVVSGAPGVKERKERPLMHHMVRTYDNQRKIFTNVTCDGGTTVLSDPGRVAEEVARVLELAREHSQPVYIEIPRDMIHRQVSMDVDNPPVKECGSDTHSLHEAVESASRYISAASKPVVIVGVEASRLGLEKRIVRMCEEANIPMATTILGKSAISERHPLSLGVYAGTMSPDRVRQVVEQSDCLVFIGVLQTDINCGFYPARLSQANAVVAAVDGLRVRQGHFEGVDLRDFVEGLYATGLGKRGKPDMPVREKLGEWVPVPGRQLTANRFFERVSHMLDKDAAIMADIGETLFGTMDYQVHDSHRYFCPAFYGTMGMAIPGTLGLMKARPGVRPIVLTGDGSFQYSCPELGNFARYGLAPRVFVLNNGGYATERMLHDGPWNDIPAWQNHKMVEVVGKGLGLRVETEDQLESAISQVDSSKVLSVVDVVIPPGDYTDGLRRFSEKFKVGCR